MKKEKRDFLKQFRYFKILDDCVLGINGESIELKKGDIIKIYNNQLEDLVFNKGGGILWDIGYTELSRTRRIGQTQGFTLKTYPEDKPLDIIEYIRMQPNFTLKIKTELSAFMTSENGAYLTQDMIDRMFNDSKNHVELFSGKHENVSAYNKRILLEFDSKLSYHGKGLKLLGAKKEDDISEDALEESTEIATQKEQTVVAAMKIKPGLYTTESSYLSLSFFLEKGEVIDFSKPEWAFSVLNQRFMKVLARSEEITSLKKKSRIYERERKDFLPNSEVRYYRLNDNVSIKSLIQLEYYVHELKEQDGLQEVGYNFNPHRVKGILGEVERENGRITVIKVIYTNPAVYQIVDKELKKISKRLNRKEAVFMQLQEVCKRQKKSEIRRKEEAKRKGKDYFRIKMIADLASTYVREQPLSEEFKHEAYEYFKKNEKKYWETRKILGYDIDGVFWNEFYMMHLIRNQQRDNRVIQATYEQEMQEKRHNLAKALSAVHKKSDNQR